jgi:hypothetical protein
VSIQFGSAISTFGDNSIIPGSLTLRNDTFAYGNPFWLPGNMGTQPIFKSILSGVNSDPYGDTSPHVYIYSETGTGSTNGRIGIVSVVNDKSDGTTPSNDVSIAGHAIQSPLANGQNGKSYGGWFSVDSQSNSAGSEGMEVDTNTPTNRSFTANGTDVVGIQIYNINRDATRGVNVEGDNAPYGVAYYSNENLYGLYVKNTIGNGGSGGNHNMDSKIALDSGNGAAVGQDVIYFSNNGVKKWSLGKLNSNEEFHLYDWTRNQYPIIVDSTNQVVRLGYGWSTAHQLWIDNTGATHVGDIVFSNNWSITEGEKYNKTGLLFESPNGTLYEPVLNEVGHI